MSQSASKPFAPYRVLRELARGGMGVVYEVVDDVLKLHDAIRLVNSGAE